MGASCCTSKSTNASSWLGFCVAGRVVCVGAEMEVNGQAGPSWFPPGIAGMGRAVGGRGGWKGEAKVLAGHICLAYFIRAQNLPALICSIGQATRYSYVSAQACGGWGEWWVGEVAGKGKQKYWSGTFVSRILLAPGICPHNYVQ